MAANGLSYAAVLDIIRLINVIVGPSAQLPESEFLFKKVCTASIQYSKQFFCKSCHYFFGENSKLVKCPDCDSPDNKEYFVTTPIKKSLERIVRSNYKDIVDYKKHLEKFSSEEIADIGNGMWARKYAKKNVLTLNINTDGVAPFSASKKKSFWPILITINNLRPNQRSEKKNVLVAAYWMSETPVIIELFFKVFIKELNYLYINGIKIGEKVYKVVVAACCLDSVARSKLLSMKQFNGSFGCTYCLHPTNKQRYPYQTAPLRTLENFKSGIADWENLSECDKKKGMAIFGIKGHSILMDIPEFDPTVQVPIDFMHCVLLGVVKTLLSFWLSPKYHKQEFYIDNSKRKLLDQKLQSIKTYSECTRKANTIMDYKTFKANELFNWMFYYSKYCLSGLILKPIYYRHYVLLIDCMDILYNNMFTIEQLDTIDEKLNSFVKTFEVLYGKEYMFYNIHLLTHITTTAKNFGPLSSTSLFTFENVNGVLNRFLNGPKGPTIQICVKHYLFFTNYYASDARILPETVAFCKKIIYKMSKRYKYGNDHRRSKIYELPENIENNLTENNIFKSYEKYYIYNNIISTNAYSKKNKINSDCFIHFMDQFYIINSILRNTLESDQTLYILGQSVLVNRFDNMQNYFEINKFQDTILFKLNQPFKKCISYTSLDGSVQCLIIINNVLIVD